MANLADVVNAFLYLDDREDSSDGISNLKLQKLVYYAQGFHLAMFDSPLFENDIEAWMHGPVVPELYHQFKECGRNPIPAPLDLDIPAIFNPEQIDLIAEVQETFGQFSAWQLRNMTHEEKPWMDHKDKTERKIPKEEMREYFKTRLL